MLDYLEIKMSVNKIAKLPIWELKNSDQRYLHWLYIHLEERGILNEKYRQIAPHERLRVMSIEIDRYCSTNKISREEFLMQTHKESKNHLLDKKYFKWIKDSDTRLIIWGLIQLNRKAKASIPLSPKQNKDRLLQFKTFFDLWNKSLQQKIGFLETLQSEWYEVSKNEKYWSWLNKKNHLQCTYVWNYLRRKNRAFEILAPCDSEEMYYAIIATFDLMPSNLTTEQKAYFFTNIKNAWYRKQYRNNLDSKKAYSFVMDIKIQNKLKELSDHFSETKNTTVERLINQAFFEFSESKNI